MSTKKHSSDPKCVEYGYKHEEEEHQEGSVEIITAPFTASTSKHQDRHSYIVGKICLWFTGANHNYLGSQKYLPPLINAGRPSHLSFYKWTRCAAK